jgi:hypothetical protein
MASTHQYIHVSRALLLQSTPISLNMKRSYRQLKLWETATPKANTTARNWARIHSGKGENLAQSGVLTGNERGESSTVSDMPTSKRKRPNISEDAKSTYVVGLCLTPRQRQVVKSMLVVEKMAYRFAAGLFARTVRGQHMLACNDPATRKTALTAPKGSDMNGRALESLGALWKYIRSVVVHTDRRTVMNRLKPEDRDLLPPERYHSSKCGVQPMVSGLTRFKVPGTGSWRKVNSWFGTMNKEGLPVYDIDERRLSGSCLVKKMYCRLLREKDVKGGDRNFLKHYLCLLPTIMAGNAFQARWTDRRHRFVRITKDVMCLPPFEHDLKIVKYGRSQYRLHIPCQVQHTRSHCKTPAEPKDALCSTDPCCRTFATVALAHGTQNKPVNTVCLCTCGISRLMNISGGIIGFGCTCGRW